LEIRIMTTSNAQTTFKEIDVDELIEKNQHRTTSEEDVTNTNTSDSSSDLDKATQVENDKKKKKNLDDIDMPKRPGHHSTDPFAPREGKTLVWKDVNMTLVSCVKSASAVFFIFSIQPI